MDAGPIMVQVEFTVDPTNADAFRIAMTEVGRNRRRHGAEQWWLFQDTADPSRFVETWIESTWAEHLRYHDRVSVTHKELEQRAQALLRRGSTMTTRHFIAPISRPSTNAVQRAVEERTKGWGGLPIPAEFGSDPDQLQIVNCNPFVNVVLFGEANPGSRPHHWASTTLPGICSAACGFPPSAPTAKALKSIE
jgi:quinol monooxygenase YgiN